MKTYRPIVSVVLCILASLLPARAATFQVTSTADTNNSLNGCAATGTGACSLREAVTSANALPGNDTITFASNVTGTIALDPNGRGLTVYDNVTITGPGANLLTIKESDANKSFDIFTVAPGVSAALSDFSLSNGNRGLFSSGTTTVTNCTLSENFTGLANNGGTATATNCTLSANVYYGLFNGGTATAINCTLSGSAYAIVNNGTATATNCTLSGNGDGLNNSGTATLQNSLVAGNSLNVRGTFTDGGYNITTGTAAQAGLDPNGLKDNGGPTQTIALQTGSPAIDAGNSSLTTDGRGQARPFNFPGVPNALGGNGSDIGAFELSDIGQSGPNFVVNNVDDHDDGVCGANDCTLREALNTLSSAPITFDPRCSARRALSL